MSGDMAAMEDKAGEVAEEDRMKDTRPRELVKVITISRIPLETRRRTGKKAAVVIKTT